MSTYLWLKCLKRKKECKKWKRLKSVVTSTRCLQKMGKTVVSLNMKGWGNVCLRTANIKSKKRRNWDLPQSANNKKMNGWQITPTRTQQKIKKLQKKILRKILPIFFFFLKHFSGAWVLSVLSIKKYKLQKWHVWKRLL